MIEITLPFPPSVNCLYDGGKKTHQRFKSKRYRDWIKDAEEALIGQAFRAFSGTPISIEYRLCEPDNRRRDLANHEKALSDFLVSNKIIEDDSLIHRLVMEWDDTINPGLVRIKISPYDSMA